jgi:peptide/nickel transport system permease protein
MEPHMRKLAAAAAQRLYMLLLTMVAGAVLTVALVSLAPGFDADEREMDLRLSEQSVAAIQAANQAEKRGPAVWGHLVNLLRGQWGFSIALHRPIRELLAERAGLTLGILAAGLAAAWAVSALVCCTLIGLHSSSLNAAATVATGGLVCVPAAIVALLAVYFRAGSAAALAAVLMPRTLRYTRSILEVWSRRPHVLAARARGIGGVALVLRHVCLPAVPEVLAVAGVSVSMAISASIPIETLCGSPGVGQLVWQAAMSRDFPVLVDLTLIIAVVTCAANLLADAFRLVITSEA